MEIRMKALKKAAIKGGSIKQHDQKCFWETAWLAGYAVSLISFIFFLAVLEL
ncbi:hypothetical protein OCV67_09945 [Porcipelethomonas ammoniilytica]|jgi:hypothetical protein|uniref:hypothetical protein n=1 Tax=Porcipelethomonas ammoniilytica TaxID=2981722 RepID=UPI0015B07EEE|nr:hypothetical protein [Porcipelethomonas ammoniilytica]MCU6720247.1 hypothetical protein [Porcipelethomonas ammoniilytica]